MQHIGVCSWSLQPQSSLDLVEKVRAAGLNAVQIALDPLGQPGWHEAATVDALQSAGIAVRSGMMRTKGEDYATLDSIRRTGGVRQDANWPENLENARRCAACAERLGIPLVTFHAGFLPPDRGDPQRVVMVHRLRAVIDAFAEHGGVRVGFETGQETADTLLDVLAQLDRPTAGVNFDPANMILYDHGDPVEALRKLAARVLQIHIKDARRTTTPGQWGQETPVGQGEVDWPAFLDVCRAAGLTCDLMIEREAGGRRLEEIRLARDYVTKALRA